MKTKVLILPSLLILSLVTLFIGQAFACSEGDYGPGCDDTTSTTTTDDNDSCNDPYPPCECTDTCPDPETTQTTYPPTTQTTYPPTTSTTYPPKCNGQTLYYCSNDPSGYSKCSSDLSRLTTCPGKDSCQATDCGTTTSTTVEKPSVIYYYCVHPEALNKQTFSQCVEANSARPGIDPCVSKSDTPTCQFKKEIPYCSDPKANNSKTQTQCEAKINKATEKCVLNNSATCTYDKKQLLYCDDKVAINYDKNGVKCIAGIKDNSKEECRQSNASCIYIPPSAKTLCLKEINGNPIVFTEKPDFTHMDSFNSFYKLCSNGGTYRYTTGVFQTINGKFQGSFRGECENPISVDDDITRCTYLIKNDDTTTTGVTDTTTGVTDTTTGVTDTTTGVTDTTTGVTDTNKTTGVTDTTTGVTDTTTGVTDTDTNNKASYLITGKVTGDGETPLPNVQVELTYGSNTISASTDSNGNYIFTGLGVGGYTLRPKNSQPYIFPHSESVDIASSNASVTVNFSGINATKVTDETIATLLNRDGDTTASSSETSLNDWLDNLLNNRNTNTGDFTSGTGTSQISKASLSNANGYSFSNVFSGNSLFSILESGYLPFSNSYTPVGLSLISKFADRNSICGDGAKQDGETCDDGFNNGKTGYCSSDCLYMGEVRFVTGNNTSSSTFNNPKSGSGSYANDIAGRLQIAGNVVSRGVKGTLDSLGSTYDATSEAIDSLQEGIKQKIIENTSPETRKVLKKVAVVAEVAATYSVIGVTALLGVLAASLHVMVFKSQWLSYTVQEGDTLDSLGDKFTMTERAMKAKNKRLKEGLRPGMKIKVRNRHFIEKDYLDQLKSVLKDGLEKRHHGKMSAKIDQIFAKK